MLATAYHSLNTGYRSDDKDGAFKWLFSNCVYGICLKLKRHVLATHQELSILRRCAEMLHGQSPRRIHIVATANQQKTNFIVNTLMHLGVSCGQIKVNAVDPYVDGVQDVWLFVTDS